MADTLSLPGVHPERTRETHTIVVGIHLMTKLYNNRQDLQILAGFQQGKRKWDGILVWHAEVLAREAVR